MRNRLFIYFINIEAPIMITYPSEASANNALESINKAYISKSTWKSNGYWIQTNNIRAMSIKGQ